MSEETGPTRTSDDAAARISYRLDEPEFAAAWHATRRALTPLLESRLVRAVFVVSGHVFLLAGLAGLLQGPPPEARRSLGPIGSVLALLGMTLIGGWLVDRWLYGRRRRLRKLFRASPDADGLIDVTLHGGGVHVVTPTSETCYGWEAYASVVRVGGGSVLSTRHGTSVWLPDRALPPTLQGPALAEFLSERVVAARTPAGRTERRPEVATRPVPSEVVGTTTYRLTSIEALAAYRAAWMAMVPGFGTRAWTLAGLAGAALTFAAGAWRLAAQLDGPRGDRDGTVIIQAACLMLVGAGLAPWFRRPDRRWLDHFEREELLAGRDIESTFTPTRLHIRTEPFAGSLDWRHVRELVEFRDGFLLRYKHSPGVAWLPADAFLAPFDRDAAASFLRSVVPKSRLIDREARRTDAT